MENGKDELQELRNNYLTKEQLVRAFAKELMKRNHRMEFVSAAMSNISAEVLLEARRGNDEGETEYS